MSEKAQDKIARGMECMAAGKYETAKMEFSEALEIDKRNYDAYVHLGNACSSLEQYDEGIDAFKKALILQPESGEALYSIGCALFLKGDSVEALRYFNQCESSGFVSTELYGLMELIYAQADDYVQAIRCANKAIKLDALNPSPYVDKAQFFIMDGKPREALATLREVEQLLPDAGEPYVVEAQIYSQNGEPEEALQVLNRALERFEEDIPMLILKARTLNDLKRFDDAMKTLESVERLAEGDAAVAREVAMVRSVAQVGLQDVKASISTLEEAVEQGEGDADMLFLLANECYALSKFKKAKKYSKQLLEIADSNPRYRASAIFWEAMSLKELGETDEARAAFDEATSTLRQINIGNPGLVEVYVYRALCNGELGRFDDAYELINHVIDLMPGEAPSYAFKAQIADMQGDKDLAKEMRDKVRELDPDFEF